MSTAEDEGFRELVEARWHRWLDVAYLVIGDERTAHEAVLDTFIHTRRSWTDLNGSPATAALRRLVRRCRTEAEGRAPAFPEDAPEDFALDELARTRADLVAAFSTLPIEQRLVLALQAVEDLTDHEIGDVLERTSNEVAGEGQSGLRSLQPVCPPSWSIAQIESELRPALRAHADLAVDGEHPWETTQLALSQADHRRRRTTVVALAALVAALIAAGGIALALRDDPKPHGQPSPTRSTSVAPPALDARSDDIKNWPLRGSLSAHPELLDPLRDSPQLDGMFGGDQPVYIDRFIFAGDIGQSRFVIGYSADVSEAQQTGLLVWSGKRGAPLNTLKPAVADGFGVVALIRRPADGAGDLLVLAPVGAKPVKVSPGPTYHLDGTATRTETRLPFTDGTASMTLPATGPDVVMVTTDGGQAALATMVGDLEGLQAPPKTESVVQSLLRTFASNHRIPVAQVTLLDQQTFRYKAPASPSFPGSASQNGPSVTGPDVDWTATMVVMRKPDGTVFRSSAVSQSGADGQGAPGPEALTDTPTDARYWRGRPMPLVEITDSDKQTIVLLAPGASSVTFSGPGAKQIGLKRIAPGVFRGPLATTAWYVDPLKVRVETKDAGGKALGSWPLITASEQDPFAQNGPDTMTTRTY
ncbi:RNA polymerase sigma factor [Luteipulveratus mongoliensis]|uniref:RNA polymerase sigma factor 70 region 4 type 2 domain-containing protein n=1 Tax=Luteipulveratus mongoliensis TaxID=571913 RepID=A0A0K1JLJ3_9MICO|nr:hypothetical protein [Luteipulveratus mongoliensis]AKU17445.1 hypothetical protein VV02_19000 [Luteipulveratus mongoliensis]